MKNTFTIFAAFFIVFISNAQFVEFDWVKQIGSNNSDSAYSITIDGIGNIYTTGYFHDTVDFDPGNGSFNMTSAGKSDIFISKLDASGNFLWAKRIGGTEEDTTIFIALDNIGNIYTTGSFQGTTDFDPGLNTFNLTASLNGDTFISKLDASGNFIWVKQFTGTTFNIGYSLSLDASGNVYTIGSFSETVDFDPGSGIFNFTANGEDDIYITKLDVSGNFIWAKQIGGVGSDGGNDIKIDATGSNIYITGEFRETVDFNPNDGVLNLSSSGIRDIFISKLNSSGNLIWANKIGGEGADRGHSIALDNSNNYIYITGEYSGTTDFNSGGGIYNLSAVAGQDCFVTKLDVSGNFIWAKSIGGTGMEEPGNCIKFDSKGNVIITGWFEGISDFDPGINTYNLTSLGSGDAFIAKLDGSGNFIWAVQLGGVSDLFVNTYVDTWSSAIDASDNIYTIGGFNSTVDFDQETGTFNLTSVGKTDIFIHKMKSESLGFSENKLKEKFKLYPNPTKSHLQINTGDIDSDVSIIVMNQLGQIIPTEKHIFSDHIDLDLKGSVGVYFIEIQSSNGSSAHFKVVKN